VGGFSSLHLLREKTTLCPFVEIVLFDNLSFVSGDKISDYDNEPLPWSDHCKWADWHDFCPRMGRLARSKNRAKRVLVNDGFKNVMFIHC